MLLSLVVGPPFIRYTDDSLSYIAGLQDDLGD